MKHEKEPRSDLIEFRILGKAPDTSVLDIHNSPTVPTPEAVSTKAAAAASPQN